MTTAGKQTEAVTNPTAARLARFNTMWEAALPIISKLVPAHVEPARVFSIAVTARQRDPRLIECTDISVLRAAILSAQFGLDISGIGGKAYMIPYYNSDQKVYEARFQFGYRGLLELVMRTGKVAAVYAREVYAGEPFEYETGLKPRLRHVPGGEPGQEIVAAWAVAQHLNGFPQPEVLYRHQIEARRRVSKAADGPAWKNWYGEMSKKTVLRVLTKTLPDSPELARAIDIEDRADLGLAPATDVDIAPLDEFAEQQEPPGPSRTEEVKNHIARSRRERAEEGEPGPEPDPEPGYEDIGEEGRQPGDEE